MEFTTINLLEPGGEFVRRLTLEPEDACPFLREMAGIL